MSSDDKNANRYWVRIIRGREASEKTSNKLFTPSYFKHNKIDFQYENIVPNE